MAGSSITDPILDMYIFEASQLIEQLEASVLASEKEGCYSTEAINDIFRVMHTIKGSSAMPAVKSWICFILFLLTFRIL